MAEKRAGSQPLAETEVALGERLNEHTEKLVDDFCVALKNKLLHAQVRYRRYDGWLYTGWEEDCRRGLLEHVKKGDPRDVAAYCAFMWHHGWSTAEAGSHDSRASVSEEVKS